MSIFQTLRIRTHFRIDRRYVCCDYFVVVVSLTEMTSEVEKHLGLASPDCPAFQASQSDENDFDL
jgi:hypothetical protein